MFSPILLDVLVVFPMFSHSSSILLHAFPCHVPPLQGHFDRLGARGNEGLQLPGLRVLRLQDLHEVRRSAELLGRLRSLDVVVEVGAPLLQLAVEAALSRKGKPLGAKKEAWEKKSGKRRRSQELVMVLSAAVSDSCQRHSMLCYATLCYASYAMLC